MSAEEKYLLPQSPAPSSDAGAMEKYLQPAPSPSSYEKYLQPVSQSSDASKYEKYLAPAPLPSATSHVTEDVDVGEETAARAGQPYVPVKLSVSDEDTRMVAPSSFGRRAVHQLAASRGIPESFTNNWLDQQQKAGKLKTYDLSTRGEFGATPDLLKATGYNPQDKSLTLHVEAKTLDQLMRDYEESKGYFRKLADVVEDPNAKAGAVAYQAVAPVVSGVAHGVDIATRPLQAASVGIAGVGRAMDPTGIIGLSDEYAGKPSHPLETLKGTPHAMAQKFMTGETPAGYTTPLTGVVENFAGPTMDNINPNLRPMVHAATEIAGDPVTYLPFAKGLRGASAAADVGEIASKESALKVLSEVPLHDEAAVASAYERAAAAGIPDAHIRAALAGESVALDASGKVVSPSFTFKQNLYSALALPKNIMTAGDLSASLRQGGLLAASHPVRAAQAFIKQLKAFASEGEAMKAMEAIKSSPRYEQLRDAGLFMPDMADSSLPMAAREELVGSRFGKHIPLVNRSDRAFNTFLTDLRFRVASDVLETHPGMEEWEVHELARTLNVLTGRGSLPGPLEAHAADVAQILFAPRLLASRIQTPLLLASRSPIARKEAARAIVSFVGANLGFLGAAKMAGADVTLDPRSSDFMRARVGNTRVDLTAGNGTMFRYASQVLLGQRKDVETGEIKNLDLKQRGKLVANFGRTRLAPQVSGPLDYALGKDVTGQPVTATDALLHGVEYLSARDLYEAYKDDKRRGGSGARGAALGSLSLLGVGVTTYRSKDATQAQKDYVRSLTEKYGEKVDIEKLTSSQASAIINRLKNRK